MQLIAPEFPVSGLPPRQMAVEAPLKYRYRADVAAES
jgi:hypothetical protein